MASKAASVKTMDSPNPCCAKLLTAYSKMEGKRDALRTGVGILKEQIDRLQLDNANLKKACDEERARLNDVEMEKGKESSLRISLEKEIAALKAEISSTKLKVPSGNTELDKQVTDLRTCISEKETEIDCLKQLLADEIIRADVEKKAAELERENVAELQKFLEREKSKADEASKRADAAAKKAEEHRIQLETSSNEVEKINLKWGEVNRMLEAEKKNAIKEKRCSEERRVQEEECRANLLSQLKEEKQKVEKLRKEMDELMSSKCSADTSELDEIKRKLEAEKKKVANEKMRVVEEKAKVNEQRKIAEAGEKRVLEEKCHANELLRQLELEKEKVEKLQKDMDGLMSYKCSADTSELDEVKRNLEAEKKKVAKEKMSVAEEKAKVNEQRKIAEASEKRVLEEKCHADELLRKLEEEKDKVEKLQRELHEKDVYSSKLDEANRNLEAEKKKWEELELSRMEEQKSLAEASIKNAMEEKCRADKLFEELVSNREMIKNLERELNKVNGLLKAESKEVAREKNRADMLNLKSEEQGKFAAANEMRALEEKSRGDNLFRELESARQKLQEMEHELNDVKIWRDLGRTSNMVPPSFAVNEQAAKVNLLHEQLKFEKKRVKHAKEVAKLEKGRNSILQQDLQRLKQDFQCLLDHLGVLSDTFGARNGVSNIPKKSGLSQMLFRGGDELRMSSLSSRDASCLLKPSMQLVKAGLCMESTSGMENELDPLQGGSHGDTIPTSALNSNTASFSDEQLVGSQERIAGSLAMPAGLSVENPKQRATVLRGSNECFRGRTGEKGCIYGEHNIRSPVEAITDHAKKRRKILDEFESIRYMHLEGKNIFQEAEKKMYALQNTVLQPMMNEQLETENFPLPVDKTNPSEKSNRSHKKRMILSKPDVVFQQANNSNVQIEVDKRFAPSAIETRESSQPLSVLERNRVEVDQDAVTNFEQMINGDYLRLLDLDDAVAEECFKMAVERPLSPILPEFDLPEFGQRDRSQPPSVLKFGNNEASNQHNFQSQDEIQLHIVLFSDLEDIGSITRIYGATRTCLARCLFFQIDFSVQDILWALQLEKDMRSREKACVLFSLALLNFSAVSSSKSVNFNNQKQIDSFYAHIRTVLFNSDTRDLFAKNCDIRELLILSEDFVLNRKIWSTNKMTCKLLDGCGLSVEILQEGKKVILWPNMASYDLVVAGSIVMASISKEVGHNGSVCEVSLKILQIDRAEYPLALSILHSFAHVCGEEYFSTSNCSLIMKVVRSVVTFMEGSLTNNANKNLQTGVITFHQFTPCVRCPFSEGSVSLDDVSSELLEELERHIVSQNSAVSAHPSNKEALFCILGDVLSSLELIADIMGWDWVHDKIVPKLFKMLESSHQDRICYPALVVLLGDIGRLGAEARGYNDTGVEDIKRHLLGLLYQTSASKCDTTLPITIVYGLIGLYPKGREMIRKGAYLELAPEEGHPAYASSDIVSKFLSSLSSEQITSLTSLVNPDIGVA